MSDQLLRIKLERSVRYIPKKTFNTDRLHPDFQLVANKTKHFTSKRTNALQAANAIHRFPT